MSLIDELFDPKLAKSEKRKAKLEETGKYDEPLESALQTAFINFMRSAFPHVVVFHVRNEKSINAIQGKQMKDQGVLAGVHDNILLWPPRNMATIELKRPTKKAEYNEKQTAFAERLDKVGFPHACCNNGESIIAALRRFGLVTNHRFPTVLEQTKKQMNQQVAAYELNRKD